MFCSKCGNQSPAGARFCNKCGTKVMNGDNNILQSTDNLVLPPTALTNHVQQPVAPAQHEPTPLPIDTMDYFAPPFAPNHIQSAIPEYPVAPTASEPLAAGTTVVHPDFMDYVYYPPTPDTQNSSESVQSHTDSLDIYEYPMQPVIKKPAKPELRAIVDQSYSTYPPPQMTPTPAEPLRPLTVNTDFANFPPLPTTASPEPQALEIPNFTDFNPPPATPEPAKPIHAPVDYMDYQPPEPPSSTSEIFLDEPPLQTTPLQDIHVKEVPQREMPIREELPIEKMQQYDDYDTISLHHPSDMVTHMPKKKNGAAIIVCIAGIAIIAVIAAIYLFSRGGSVNPEQLIGTWTPTTPQMGTQVARLEFREDGTGRSYQFDEFHNAIRDELHFSWSIEDGNRLRNTLWAQTADVEILIRAGHTILRYQLDGHDYAYEYRQVIQQNE